MLIYYFIMNKLYSIFPILGVMGGCYFMGITFRNNIEMSKKEQKEIAKFIDEKYDNN